ncbi:unnamed protein product [Darwinula stevensoni]|uniref:Disintegrin and metalloproteinase domain-containing protein 12 n=1 Tax=Darwinula stevensoni TaxID=69355 RepID=A0A7R9A4U7_9CRUS|nr:unnamed protein product [Darwinula stevensoni]CAG0885028.1 unnamed protein product [Darwinula stevensoni]
MSSSSRGVLFDGEELYHVENEKGREKNHVLLAQSHLKPRNWTCGYPDSERKESIGLRHHLLHRGKRSVSKGEEKADDIKDPWNAKENSRFVELVLVVDNAIYKSHDGNRTRIIDRCKKIANIVNALYAPLNIFVALVGVVIWTELDEITLKPNGDETLTNFLHYRRERLVAEIPNDNAQLLTNIQFEGGVVGKALKGPICTFKFSGGVNMDHSQTVGLVATTVAHEMGHNFGMEHDEEECDCPESRCIMAPSSSSLKTTHWSSCSREYLALAFAHGMEYCLRNRPRTMIGPVCGNGFVEPGEQCDCGLPEFCDNRCCDPTTCMLTRNSTCATGQCCDLNILCLAWVLFFPFPQTCKPKKASTSCRPALHECDLPEFCTGNSEFCPEDTHKQDGSTCHDGKVGLLPAYCYAGSCRTHTDQCRMLWGPTGRSSDDRCYKRNTKGDRHGNCGYFHTNETFTPCAEGDVMCGMLHCSHRNERLEFGMESVSILSHTFIQRERGVIPCRTAIVDLGLDQVDPGLTPDGAKCGEGKMCVKQKCRLVESVQSPSCSGGCFNHGVCNSKGHCHCDVGYAPPHCMEPGPGGSVDSGPASDSSGLSGFVIAMYIIFLGILPIASILACLIFYGRRENIKIWCRNPAQKTGTGSKFPGFPSFPRKPHSATRNSGPHGSLDISSPILESPSHNAKNSLLLHEPALKGEILANGEVDSSPLSPGHYRGFSFQPLHGKEPENRPTAVVAPVSHSRPTSPNGSAAKLKPARPAPPVPAKNPDCASENTTHKIAHPSSILKAISSNSSGTSPANDSHRNSNTRVSFTLKDQCRPTISGPILNQTSANLSVANLTETRPEGVSHVAGSPAIVSLVGHESTDEKQNLVSERVKRFESNPVVEVPPVKVIRDTVKSSSETGSVSSETDSDKTSSSMSKWASRLVPNISLGRTLSSRLANQQEKPKPVKKPDKHKFSTLPRNSKFKNLPRVDREILRGLEISNPIPQKEIDVPALTIPVKSLMGQTQPQRNSWSPTSPEAPTDPSLSRGESMRAATLTPKPQIPHFGSLRGAKRPLSVPSARPTSPPPRPPPVKQEELHYINENAASQPLSLIEEECTSLNGNIYEKIDEGSPDKDFKGSAPSHNSSADDLFSTNTRTKSDDNLSAGSSESTGLLSEILSELKTRNVVQTGTKTEAEKSLGGMDTQCNGDGHNVGPTYSNVVSTPVATVASTLTSSINTMQTSKPLFSSSSSYKPSRHEASALSTLGNLSGLGASSVTKPKLETTSSLTSTPAMSASIVKPAFSFRPVTSAFNSSKANLSTKPMMTPMLPSSSSGLLKPSKLNHGATPSLVPASTPSLISTSISPAASSVTKSSLEASATSPYTVAAKEAMSKTPASSKSMPTTSVPKLSTFSSMSSSPSSSMSTVSDEVKLATKSFAPPSTQTVPSTVNKSVTIADSTVKFTTFKPIDAASAVDSGRTEEGAGSKLALTQTKIPAVSKVVPSGKPEISKEGKPSTCTKPPVSAVKPLLARSRIPPLKDGSKENVNIALDVLHGNVSGDISLASNVGKSSHVSSLQQRFEKTSNSKIPTPSQKS